MLAAMVGMIACDLDKLPVDTTKDGDELGYLQMGDVVVTGDIENKGDGSGMDVESGRPRTRTEVSNLSQAADSYWVEIVNVVSKEIVWSGTYASAKTTTKYSDVAGQIGLEPGTYVVYAYQTEAKEPAEGVTDAPYYTGVSDQVEIVTSREQHDNVPTVEVICSMANTKVTVEHSADLKMLFKSMGDNSIDVNPAEGKDLQTDVVMSAANIDNTASHHFNWDSSVEEPVYFSDIAGSNNANGNTLTLELTGTYYTGKPTDIYDADFKGEKLTATQENNWKEVKMTHTINNVKAAQWRKISIDIDNNTTGNVKFIFTIESFTYDEEIEVKMMEIFADLNMEESMPDDEISDPLAPVVKITGNADNNYNYAIDSSKFDSNSSQSGNIAWIKYFNATITPQDGTTVEKVYAVLKYTTDERLRDAMVSKGFANSRVDLYPDNKATNYANISSSGSKLTLALTTMGMNTFYKYPGEHTIRLYTEDSEHRVGYVDIVLTVTQDSASSGDGPTIVWMKDGADVIDQIHKLTSASPYETLISITSEKGITSLLVDIDAELLSPEELSNFKLAASMDLVAPTTVDMETGLRNLGFLPVESGFAAKDDDNYRIFDPATGKRKEGKDSPLYMQNNVEFSITNFTGLLWSLYDGQKTTVKDFIAMFKITAIDAGGSTIKEVKFEMVCE